MWAYFEYNDLRRSKSFYSLDVAREQGLEVRSQDPLEFKRVLPIENSDIFRDDDSIRYTYQGLDGHRYEVQLLVYIRV